MKEVIVNDVVYVVKKPTPKNESNARVFIGGVFRNIANSDTPPITRDTLPEYMKKLGIWGEDKLTLLTELANKINDGERQLKRGGRKADGSKFTKNDAKELAIDMRKWRGEQINLVLQMRKYDHLTLEGITDNARFDYLVSECCFTKDGKKVFKSYDDYQSKAEEDYSSACAEALAELMYGTANDMLESERKNPENKFLVDYKFAREDDLHLIDENGNLVDVDGVRINKDGYRVDENNNPIDKDGNPLTENGEPIEEFTPFE